MQMESVGFVNLYIQFRIVVPRIVVANTDFTDRIDCTLTPLCLASNCIDLNRSQTRVIKSDGLHRPRPNYIVRDQHQMLYAIMVAALRCVTGMHSELVSRPW